MQRLREVTPEGKRRARQKATLAKKRGILEQHPCELCLSPNSEMHHPDYRMPFMVRWLCRKCHFGVHARERQIAAVAWPPTLRSSPPPRMRRPAGQFRNWISRGRSGEATAVERAAGIEPAS